MKNNYYNLISMRVLKKIITIFTDSFLVLYFMQLSNNNIIPIGIYNLFEYTVLIIIILAIKNLLKNKNRIYLLRIGMVFNFIFFVLLLLLNDKVINYAWLLGIIYGIEEGLYFSVFNIYESEISSEKRASYTGNYTALESVSSVVIPILFGSIMSFSGFGKCTFLVLILVLAKLVLTFLYKDKKIPKGDKTDLIKYLKIIKENKDILNSHITSFTKALTYSGAFTSLITIYIIKVFKTGFSLGILTSILSLITALAGFIFAKFIKRKDYKIILIISNILTIISLVFMIIKCTPLTIIIFNFIQSFAKTYIVLIDNFNTLAISNIKEIKNKYKEEYFIMHEVATYVGRLISYLVFCLLAFADTSFKTNIVMIIFIIFIIIRMVMSLKLQKISNKYNC